MDKIKGTKNSHIQVPRFILEGFSTPETICNNEGYNIPLHKIFRLDMKLNIEQLDIKDCNVEKGYYEDWIEDVLSIIETKFGNIKKKLFMFKKAFLKSTTYDLQLTDDDVDVIIEYVKLCLLRSPDLSEQILKNSAIAGMLDNTVPNTVFYYYFKYKDIQQQLNDCFAKRWCISCLINKSDVNLILPQQYAFGRYNDKEVIIILPLAFDFALLLTTYQIPNTVQETSSYVDIINKMGIKSEFNTNRCAIYAKTKNDIERYIPFIKQHCKI